MKYALKPSSRVLDVKGSNKIIMFKDEKQLIGFFHKKMQLDLVNPVVKSEDRKSTRLNSSHSQQSRMPSSA